MSDQTTKSDLKDLEQQLDRRFAAIDKRFDDLTALMSGFANDIDSKLSVVESKLADHDGEFRKLNEKYDHLINTIDGFIGRIDDYETELAARDHKIDRLERWIQEIAAKTNIQLN